MPEYPDIELYTQRLDERLTGRKLDRVRFYSAFILRSVGVPPAEVEGRSVVGLSRLGKRIVIELEEDRFILIHLMVAGRLQWITPPPPEKTAMGKVLLASFRFADGQLNLVEMSTKKRASIYLLRSRADLLAHRRPGLDVFTASATQ